MDLLKRQWFWLLCAVLVLGCGAYYVLEAWRVASSNEAMAAELQTSLGTLQGWVQKPAALPTRAEVEAQRQHAEQLKEALAACHARLKHPNRWKPGIGSWTLQQLEEVALIPSKFQSEYIDRLFDLKKQYPVLKAGFSDAQYGARLPGTREEALQDGKRLMIQTELARLMGESGVLRLKQLVFANETGQTSGDALPSGDAAAPPSLRPAQTKASTKWERIVHSFRFQVDLDIKDLPGLLDRLAASSFNLATTGLVMQKIKNPQERRDLVEKELLPEDRRNEVVRVVLACEATEFLFETPPPDPKGKP